MVKGRILRQRYQGEIMDFDIVKRQVVIEYLKLYGNPKEGDTWSLWECIEIFRYYYERYYKVFGVEHPHLSSKSISTIISNLPYFSTDTPHNVEYDFTPDEYPIMIDAYFSQDFTNCNYSIAHFMSGDIRMLRVYECIY